MFSSVVAIGVALVVSLCARLKGRTAWHWFALSLAAFATIWGLSFVGLHLARIETLHNADRTLGIFAGATAGAIMIIVVLFVPKRQKFRSRRSAKGEPRLRRTP
jgi:hypothetical protein